MRSFFYFSLLLIFTGNISIAQDEIVLWAKSYTVSNCVEMGGLAVDSSENIIIAGVHEAPFSLPFKGDVYLKKTNPDGNIIWQKELLGDIVISDINAQNEDILISGQAFGIITIDGIEYGGDPYYLYVFRLDSEGNVLWYYFDLDKSGTYSNIAFAENNQCIVHARTQSNQGDWILIFDENGAIVQSRLLHPTITLIDDIAYYQGNYYMSGDLNGLSAVVIDTVFIPQSPLESTAFVLALNSSLIAQWVALDTTLNNSNGKIEVNENGVFVFQENLEPPFSITSHLKHFDYSGNKIKEIELPVFSAGAALLPSMTLTGDRLALYVKNSFSSNSFKLMIFDDDLDLITEKSIDGNSDQYSNHIRFQKKNFILGHIYESTLNLNNEMTLPYEGPGKQPYVAKIGVEEVVISGIDEIPAKVFEIYPNPADQFVNVVPTGMGSAFGIQIIDITGKLMIENTPEQNTQSVDVSGLAEGVYFIRILQSGTLPETHKLLIK